MLFGLVRLSDHITWDATTRPGNLHAAFCQLAALNIWALLMLRKFAQNGTSETRVYMQRHAWAWAQSGSRNGFPNTTGKPSIATLINIACFTRPWAGSIACNGLCIYRDESKCRCLQIWTNCCTGKQLFMFCSVWSIPLSADAGTWKYHVYHHSRIFQIKAKKSCICRDVTQHSYFGWRSWDL